MERLNNSATFQGDYPDPSITKYKDTYYLVFSSMQYRPALPLFSSTNLTEWKFVGFCLKEFERDIWAPEITVINNRLQIYFYAEKENWVIYCDNIDDFIWSSPIQLDIKDYIDPGYLRFDDKNYLFLGKGMMCELSEDGLSRISEITKVFPDYIVDSSDDIEGDFVESPKLLVRDNMIYYTVTTGGTAGPATGHRVISARSKTLKGPWEFSPYNPIIVAKDRNDDWHCQGHATIFQGDDAWYSIYHSYLKDSFLWGRQCIIEKMDWDNDGWYYRTNERIEGKIKNIDQLQDEFVSFKKQAGITKRDKGIELVAKGLDLGSSEKVMFPYASNSFECLCTMDMSSETYAGIMMFYNEIHNAGISVNKKSVQIIRHNEVLNTVSFEENIIKIKIVVENLYWKPYVSLNGIDYIKINNVIDISGFNHNNYGGFLALKPGFFCYGMGKASFTDIQLN